MDVIKLGRKMGEPMPAPTSPSKDAEMYYPSVYLEWDKDYEFPAEGTMTVKFVRTGRSENESRDGKTRYTVNLDLTELSDVKPSKDAKESKDESTDEALDRLKEEYEGD